MKLSSKLPTRNGLDESALPSSLIRAPQRTRLLIVEVQTSKIETLFDEYGDAYQVPTAQVVAAEYITNPTDCMTAKMIARKAFDDRRGADTLPDIDSPPADLLRDGVGYLAPNRLIDHETGEILEDTDA